MINVEGHSNYKRDPSNNSIVNTDLNSYKEYNNKLKRLQNQEDRIANIENKLEKIMEILLNNTEIK